MMMWAKKEEEESESEEESINPENIDEGPEICMIPSQLIDTACTINPSKPIGIRLTPEGWIEFVKEGSFASRSNVKIGTRVVRVESQRCWNFIESKEELKNAIKNSINYGDEEVVIMCSGILKGEMKWQGAVKSSYNGKIYGIPSNAREVLCIDPLQQIAYTFGQVNKIENNILSSSSINHDMWFGGVEVLNKSNDSSMIYAIPFNAQSFLSINPSTNLIQSCGGTLLYGKNKYRGGVCDMYGRIHCIPCDASQICLYDPKLNKYELYGDENTMGNNNIKKNVGNNMNKNTTTTTSILSQCMNDSNKYYGGIYCEHDDRILAIPFDATSILIIDPEYKQISLIFENDILLKGKSKFSGGVLALNNQCIYCIPYNSTFVLKIDIKLKILKRLDAELEGYGKWSGGVYCEDIGDGQPMIYGIPYLSDTILKINPITDEVNTVGVIRSSKGRLGLWRGGSVGNDGNVYGIPCDSPTVIQFKTCAEKFNIEEETE